MKTEILRKFKEQNPKLVSLNPKIEIDEIKAYNNSETKEWVEYNPPLLRICVYHPFIFDNRLIPKEFDGIEVCNFMIGDFPKEFPYKATIANFEFHAIANYQKFVDNNFDYIKKKLKSTELSNDEIIDALTGGTKKLIKANSENKLKFIRENEAEILFFRVLLEKTRKAYFQSDVCKTYGHKGWGYSVTATMIRKNKPLIVGFNWGVDKDWVKAGNIYGAQRDYPFRIFESNYYEMGSLKRVIPLLHEYIPRATEGMQTNFCFFRSEKEEQISKKDLKLCTPLFDEYIEFAEPSILISFSNKLLSYLQESNKLKNIETKKIKSGNKTLEILKATMYYNNINIPFAYIPHPNYPMTTEARKKAWEFHFQNTNY